MTGSPLYHFEIPEAKGGRSLIGACIEPSTPSVNHGVIRAIFGFSNKYEFIEPTKSLEPGRGYWIHLSEPTTLQVEKGE